MVTAHPFRGLRFASAVVGDPAAVTAPPYDAITPERRDHYAAVSPYNVMRVLLAATTTPHNGSQAAAKLLTSWRREGALVQDPLAGLYVHEQTWQEGDRQHTRRGVLASVPLDPSGTRILPHERTITALAADRQRLLDATGVNLSPVFGVYAGGGHDTDELAAMTAGPPLLASTDELGERHRLWQVTDPGLIAAWQARIAGLEVLIADGHHRYDAALAHRAQVRASRPQDPAGPWDEVLMLLVDADTGGVTTQAVHRLAAGLDTETLVASATGTFEAWSIAKGAGHRPPVAAVEEALGKVAPDRAAFGVMDAERAWLLLARDWPATTEPGGRQLLDVEVLHDRLLSGFPDSAVAYERDVPQALRRVDRGEFGVLVLLRPIPAAEVFTLARAGRTLPQKTTWFAPKPRDGLVLRVAGP